MVQNKTLVKEEEGEEDRVIGVPPAKRTQAQIVHSDVKVVSLQDAQAMVDLEDTSEAAVKARPVAAVSVPKPPNEAERLQRIRDLKLTEIPNDGELNDLVELVQLITETKKSVISVIDDHAMHVKAGAGIPSGVILARDVSFCNHVISSQASIEVSNLAADVRFACNPYVVQHGFRSYVGVPINMGAGAGDDSLPVGSVCAIDPAVKTFSESQKKALEIIARMAARRMADMKVLSSATQLARQVEEAEKRARDALAAAESATLSSFENLLLSGPGLEAYMAFVKKERSDENLDFWLRGTDFRNRYAEFEIYESEPTGHIEPSLTLDATTDEIIGASDGRAAEAMNRTRSMQAAAAGTTTTTTSSSSPAAATSSLASGGRATYVISKDNWRAYMVRDARKLFDEFFRPNAPRLLNLSSHDMKIVRDKLGGGVAASSSSSSSTSQLERTLSAHVFDIAINEVQRLLKNDSFKRFLQSKDYQHLQHHNAMIGRSRLLK